MRAEPTTSPRSSVGLSACSLSPFLPSVSADSTPFAYVAALRGFCFRLFAQAEPGVTIGSHEATNCVCVSVGMYRGVFFGRLDVRNGRCVRLRSQRNERSGRTSPGRIGRSGGSSGSDACDSYRFGLLYQLEAAWQLSGSRDHRFLLRKQLCGNHRSLCRRSLLSVGKQVLDEQRISSVRSLGAAEQAQSRYVELPDTSASVYYDIQ